MMNLFTRSILLVTLLVMSAHARPVEYETILAQGDILEPGTTLKTPNGQCLLKLQRDGNLIATRRGPYWGTPGTSDPVPKSISWTSGSAQVVANYYATVTPKGNLAVVNRGTNETVYSTHVYDAPQGEVATHELVFTNKCTLRILRNGNDRVWSNIHEWFDNFSADDYPGLDNVLHKGEYYTYPTQNYGTMCGTGVDLCIKMPFSLRLQHDCNLVAFVGHDQGDFGGVVWSAGVARPNADNCLFLVTSHDVALYEGSFDPTSPVDSIPPNKYWSVPSSFFDVDSYSPQGRNWYQVLINNEGEMYLDWD